MSSYCYDQSLQNRSIAVNVIGVFFVTTGLTIDRTGNNTDWFNCPEGDHPKPSLSGSMGPRCQPFHSHYHPSTVPTLTPPHNQPIQCTRLKPTGDGHFRKNKQCFQHSILMEYTSMHIKKGLRVEAW